MSTNPLAQLRDIHLPAPIGWWPPAPGWIFLVGLLFISLFVLGVYLLKKHHRNRAKRQAIAELQQLIDLTNPVSIVVSIVAILKRVARHYDQNPQVTTLKGQAWLHYLQTRQPKLPCSESVKLALTQSLYQPRPRIHVQPVIHYATQWVKHV